MERIGNGDHSRRCVVCGSRAQWAHNGSDYCVRNECQLVAAGTKTADAARRELART